MSEDAITRLEGMGLTDLGQRDPCATLRRSLPTIDATEKSAARTTTARELPMISLDLRTAREGASAAASADGRPRDLEILSLLGEGGMGRVYLARQHSLDRDVAIKTLREDAHLAHRQALLEEGAVTGFLEHPAIIPVHALGVDTTHRPVLVMKRVEGVSWLDLIRDASHPAWASWGGDPARRLDDHLEILRQVCNAAHFAHSRGIVHRDVKPQNVLIGRFGDVYLADWGIAYRMDRGVEPEICGTPAYMAPEMALGGAIDARTDVYLLGATLHEVLTGRVKHTGANALDAVKAIALSDAYAYGPGVPLALARIANRATSVDPKDRYASAAELRDALADYARHRTSVALGESALDRLARLSELVRETARHTSEEAQHELEQLIVETRFGLTQALEQWSANAAAREGLEELESLLATRRARTAELERLATDLDPAVDARRRVQAQIAVGAVGVAMSIVALAKGVDFQPSATDLIKEGVFPVVGFAIAAFVFRKALLRTAINRRAAQFFGVAVTLILVGRLISWRAGTPPSQMLVQDCLIGAAAAFVTSASTFRWMAWLGLLMTLTAAACGVWPEHAAFAFAIGSAAALMAGAALGATRAA